MQRIENQGSTPIFPEHQKPERLYTVDTVLGTEPPEQTEAAWLAWLEPVVASTDAPKPYNTDYFAREVMLSQLDLGLYKALQEKDNPELFGVFVRLLRDKYGFPLRKQLILTENDSLRYAE